MTVQIMGTTSKGKTDDRQKYWLCKRAVAGHKSDAFGYFPTIQTCLFMLHIPISTPETLIL